jgi:hypothetical protein
MADKKISALTAATTPLAGTEVLPIVQSGATVKVSIADVTAGRAVSATSIATGLGAVGTPAYTFTGDTNTGIFSPAADTIAFVEGGVEAMRINSDGNVGIGTTSLSSGYGSGKSLMLTNQSAVLFQNASNTWNTTTAGGGVTYFSDNNLYLDAKDSASNMIFRVNGATERMRITSAGDVGIGTTSPASGLELSSNTGANIFSTTYADNLGGGNYVGRKARGTSSAPTGALTDDQLAVLFARGYTSASAFSGNVGGIGIYAAENFTGTNNGTYVAFATTAIGATGRTERVRISSAGNVGIGETAPDYKLDVNGTFGFTPGASVTPVDNGDVVFELTSNTTLTVKAKGSDGVVRSGTIVLV